MQTVYPEKCAYYAGYAAVQKSIQLEIAAARHSSAQRQSSRVRTYLGFNPGR